MRTCVILHNLTIDFEGENGLDSSYINSRDYQPEHPFVLLDNSGSRPLSDIQKTINLAKIRNSGLHLKLKSDLTEHYWNAMGCIEN